MRHRTKWSHRRAEGRGDEIPNFSEEEEGVGQGSVGSGRRAGSRAIFFLVLLMHF